MEWLSPLLCVYSCLISRPHYCHLPDLIINRSQLPVTEPHPHHSLKQGDSRGLTCSSGPFTSAPQHQKNTKERERERDSIKKKEMQGVWLLIKNCEDERETVVIVLTIYVKVMEVLLTSKQNMTSVKCFIIRCPLAIVYPQIWPQGMIKRILWSYQW